MIKKRYLFLILIISMFTISSVNAMNNEIQLSSSTMDKIVSIDNNNKILSANDGTYSELSSEIDSGGNLTLSKSLYKYDFGSTINISQSGTIDGNGAVIDMAGSTIQVFNVKTTGVTIKDITFKNVNCDCNGGAIYFGSSGTVKNCNFNNNTITKYHGGAIYFNDYGTVENCNFNDNSASTYGNGGAIYFNNQGTVTNSNFTGNTANNAGGAICFNNQGTVNNCNFVTNIVKYNLGGAIYIKSGSVRNSNFTGNTVDYYGGAIYLNGEGSVENCNFVANTARYGGGAIYTTYSNTINNCNFRNNKATSPGGAIYIDARGGEINNCNFSNNVADSTYYGEGGAIYLKSGTIIYSNFIDNSATCNGGAIYLNGTSTVDSCNFISNYAKSDGGAIYSTYSGTVENCNFTNNQGYKGGAINIISGRITSCDFNNNNAKYGGAIYFYSTRVGGTVSYSNLIDNFASQRGGAIYSTYSGTIDNCNLINNNVTGTYGYGGAIYFKNKGTVNYCTLLNNTANNEAGAIYFDSSSEISRIMYSNFTNNKGNNYAGAIMVKNKIDVNNCNFLNNTAEYYGGAIYFDSSIETGTVTYSNFINNSAKDGAAIYTNKRVITRNSNFINNNATSGFAGAIRFNDVGIVDKCNFISNCAFDKTAYGGAIYFKTDGTIENSKFTNNCANGSSYSCGGAFYINNIGTVKNCTFINNTAKSHGGAIYFYKEGNVTNSIFNNNIAGTNGGAIEFTSKCYVDTCTFNNNIAGTNGGALNIGHGNVTNSIFNNNIAESDGGAIEFRGAGNVTNSIFNNNIVFRDAGAIIFNNEGDATNNNFTNNNAYRNGGAICFRSGNITNNNFDSNTASEYGGAIYISGSYIYLSENTMTNCVGLNDSAPIYTYYTLIYSKTNLIITKDCIIKLGENVTINAELTDDYGNAISGGRISLTANYETLDTMDIINGSVSTVFTPTIADTYIISGSNELTKDLIVKTATIEVDNSYIITAPNVTKYYGGYERFIVTVQDYSGNPIANANVNITINGNTYPRTTSFNGQASIGLNLNSGNYNVTTNYENIIVKSTVVIKDTVISNDFTKIYRNGTQYYGTFVDSQGNLIKNTVVKLNINGVFYTRTTNDYGVAHMNINLNPGTYILTAENHLSGEQHTTKIIVLPSIVENYDLTKYYRNASKYTLRIIGDNGKPVGEGVTVKLNINGVFYERKTNASGYMNMNINLPPGTYTVTAEYNGLKASNKIAVLSILETKDLSMKYHDGSKFEAKILDGQGKPYSGQTVNFNINGVFYSKETDEEGIARLNINLMAGEYIITSMFNGLNAANKVTISG